MRGERAWDGKGEAKMLTGLGLWGRRLGRKLRARFAGEDHEGR